MHLLPDGYTCAETPTCEQWGACSQQCSVTFDNSKKCYCNANYTLDADLYSCNHDGKINILLVEFRIQNHPFEG